MTPATFLGVVLVAWMLFVVLFLGYYAAKEQGYRRNALIAIALVISVFGTFLIGHGYAQSECRKVGWQSGRVALNGIICTNSDARRLDDIDLPKEPSK